MAGLLRIQVGLIPETRSEHECGFNSAYPVVFLFCWFVRLPVFAFLTHFGFCTPTFLLVGK